MPALVRRSTSTGAALLTLIAMGATASGTGWRPVLSVAAQTRASGESVSGSGCGAATAYGLGCVAAGSVAQQDASPRLVVPNGAHPCPSSGPGASCSGEGSAPPAPGVASLPDGGIPCPSDPAKVIASAPGVCDVSPGGGAATPSADVPSGAAIPALNASLTRATSHGPGASASKSTKGARPNPEIQLSADRTTLASGDQTLLTATVATSVTGTPWVIDIFDQTTQTLAGACAQGSTCQVAYATTAGDHTFLAYVAPPSAALPAGGIRLTSNALVVRWLGISIQTTSASVVGPGKPVTFTAVASEDVGKIGYRIELVDATTGQGLTYCSSGTTCSSAVIETSAGTHSLVADLTPVAAGGGSQAVREKSTPVSATWLSVALTATTTSPSQGGSAWLSASANADLTNTPWAIFIYMSPRLLVDPPCQSATCTVAVALPTGTTPSFFAVIAREADVSSGSDPLTAMLDAARTGSPQSDIQARSAVVTPSRILWGVDSCAAFTQDAAGSTGLLPQVISMLGVRDFWARYLPDTGNCPALSSTEVAAARSLHMGILPIYNNYDCSAVSGYAAGAAYAAGAVQIAQADQIPSGTGIAVDIEPPGDQCPGAGNVDAGFISGWYDVISGSGYAPVYYGNTTPGSAFGQAWCATVAQRPEIQTSSYLWSFEPDLSGQFAKQTAPAFSPFASGCGGQYDAWQYQINLGWDPQVDHDEATSRLPIWYP